MLVSSPAKIWNLQTVFSLNFCSVGKGPFLTGKAKKMHQRHTLLAGVGRGASNSWTLLFSTVLSTNWPKSILNTSKQRILWIEAAFATGVNLITQVVEVANLSCWLKKSRIGRESYETLLACSAWKGTSRHLNRVIRDSSCGYFNTLCWTLHNSPNGDYIRERWL